MLKKRVKKLMDRYEGCEEWLSSYDVQEELEEIMDDEPWDDKLSPGLQDAIDEFILQRHDAERGGGRIPDGSDEFIEKVKEIIGYED